MLRLRATYGGRTATAPARADLSIGSASDNDLVIAARGVSRYHARVARASDHLTIVDAGSKNGLIVAGVRQHEIVLRDQTVFSIGEAVVRIERISTSDVELGLEMPGGQVPDASSGTGRTTAAALGGSGMAAALRWAQRAESGLDSATLLDEARSVVRAESLVAFVPNGTNDISVVELAGQLPSHDDVAQILRGDAGWLVAGSGDTQIAARLTAPRGVRAAEYRDFLTYAADRLFSATPQLSRRYASNPAVLSIPEEYVVGVSAAARRLLAEIEQIARGHVDVLITGETGVGKELVARIIHQSGPNPHGPFVAVNVTTMTPEIADAELFGVAHRAATGVDARAGCFEIAAGGTLFLDEIGDLPLAIQPKLLRVLQEREVRRVGAGAAKKVDLRVIFSTNRDLDSAVGNGSLRSDLFFRLGVQIRVPPLRARREDIPALVLALTASAAHAEKKSIAGVSRRALEQLVDHDWPGNVRELKNAITRAVILISDGGAIESTHFAVDNGYQVPTALGEMKRATIERALRRSGGNKAAAAKLLGISRQGLYDMLQKFRLR